jgi:hypothetical protein
LCGLADTFQGVRRSVGDSDLQSDVRSHCRRRRDDITEGIQGEKTADLVEIRFGRRTDRVEPSADVHLCMRLPAEVTCSVGIGGFLFPPENRELNIATLNHEPMHGLVGDGAADFASEFLKSGHRFKSRMLQPSNGAQQSINPE